MGLLLCRFGEKSTPFSDIEHDVLSALINLGCQSRRPRLPSAKPWPRRGARQFESLFRKPLNSFVKLKLNARERHRFGGRSRRRAAVRSRSAPKRLSDFTGQPKLKENLAIAIEAARLRGEALDHVLLYGPPGLGKTTLATIIANELEASFQQTSGPILQKKFDLTGILTTVTERQVFFIDEIHRLMPDIEEILYSALEDFQVDLVIGQGPGARPTRCL